MKLTKALIGLLIIIGLSLACNFPTPSTQVENAYLSSDYEGIQATKSFSPENPFNFIVKLSNLTENTPVTAVWTTQEVQGLPPDFVIGETKLISGNGIYHFELKNEGPWPIGRYKVDLFLNNERNLSLEFEVK